MTTIDIAARELAVGPAAAAASRQARANLALRLVKGLLSAALSVGVVLFAWWFFLEYFQVKAFIGKSPSEVWSFLFTADGAAESRHLIFEEAKVTIRDAFLGLASGTIAAVLAAIAFNAWRSVERTLLPIAMVLRSVPLVAMTPLIVLIFGRDILGVTVIAGIVTFFPTLVNVSLALRSTPKESIDLLRAYGASPTKTLFKVQIPSALPALFASLRVAAPLALVGALLAEWLATGKGLGYAIAQSEALSKYNDMWARVVFITLFSVLLYKLIGAVERMVLARFAPIYNR